MGTPITSTSGDDGEFRDDDGSSDGGSDFLGAFDTETDVTKSSSQPCTILTERDAIDLPVEVSNSDESLEPRPLPSRSLFLNRSDAHDLVLEGGEEHIDNLIFLDGEREEVDLFHRLDLAVLDESTELGDGDPEASCQ